MIPKSRTATATLTAFVLAPLISTLIYALTSTDLPDDIIDFTVALLLFYFFCSLATLVFGMPLYFLLRRFKLVSWWSTGLSGIIIGAIIAVLVSLQHPVHDRSLIFYCGIGAVTGLGFWLIRRLGLKFVTDTKPPN